MKLEQLKKELRLPASQTTFTDSDLKEFSEEADEVVDSASDDIKFYLTCYDISQALGDRNDIDFYKAKILAKLGLV